MPNYVHRWQQKDYETLAKFLYAHNLANNLSYINTNLYNSNLINWTKTLNSLMTTSKCPKELYRGVRRNFNIDGKGNMSIVNKSFISTSKNIRKAAIFGDLVIKFKLPTHIKSFEFPKRNGHKLLDEEEVLIERNTKFQNIQYMKTVSFNRNGIMKQIHIFKADLIKYYKPKCPTYQFTAKNLNMLEKNSSNESSNFEN